MDEEMQCDSTVSDRDLEQPEQKQMPQEQQAAGASGNFSRRIESIVTLQMTQEDFDRDYWPKLDSAISQLLTLAPGEYIPISYEQVYSCVYKCVCKQYADQLYAKLVDRVSLHLEQLSSVLNHTPDENFVNKFYAEFVQYNRALSGIVPIFNYMNRFYCETKLKQELKSKLEQLFIDMIANKLVQRLLQLLEVAQATPFAVSPPVMAGLIKGLYEMKAEYAQLSQELFAAHIPNILPPMHKEDIQQQMQEVQQYQENISNMPRGDGSKKRGAEDDGRPPQ